MKKIILPFLCLPIYANESVSRPANHMQPEPKRTCCMLPDKPTSHDMSSSAVQCDACGAIVPDLPNLRFCLKCGAKVVYDDSKA